MASLAVPANPESTPQLWLSGDAFWEYVDTSGGDAACWPWLGSLSPEGYGTGSYKSNQEYMHRQAYKVAGGHIPPEFTLDHLCHTRDYRCPGGRACLHRRCCNPSHLEPVTRGENSSRAVARRGTRRTEERIILCHSILKHRVPMRLEIEDLAARAAFMMKTMVAVKMALLGYSIDQIVECTETTQTSVKVTGKLREGRLDASPAGVSALDADLVSVYNEVGARIALAEGDGPLMPYDRFIAQTFRELAMAIDGASIDEIFGGDA